MRRRSAPPPRLSPLEPGRARPRSAWARRSAGRGVGEAALRRGAAAAGLRFERRVGPRFASFGVLRA